MLDVAGGVRGLDETVEGKVGGGEAVKLNREGDASVRIWGVGAPTVLVSVEMSDSGVAGVGVLVRVGVDGPMSVGEPEVVDMGISTGGLADDIILVRNVDLDDTEFLQHPRHRHKLCVGKRYDGHHQF